MKVNGSLKVILCVCVRVGVCVCDVMLSLCLERGRKTTVIGRGSSRGEVEVERSQTEVPVLDTPLAAEVGDTELSVIREVFCHR